MKSGKGGSYIFFKALFDMNLESSRSGVVRAFSGLVFKHTAILNIGRLLPSWICGFLQYYFPVSSTNLTSYAFR